MTKQERLQEALRTMDFYELAKLTYERSNNMKIKVKDLTPETQELTFSGNKLFTKEQLEEIMRA